MDQEFHHITIMSLKAKDLRSASRADDRKSRRRTQQSTIQSSLDENKRADPTPEYISAYDAEQYFVGSRFKAMSGLKTHSQVKDWARLTPFSLENNMLNRKIGPGRMPMRDDGKVYVRAQ